MKLTHIVTQKTSRAEWKQMLNGAVKFTFDFTVDENNNRVLSGHIELGLTPKRTAQQLRKLADDIEGMTL